MRGLICSATCCDNDITTLVEDWEAGGRKGRPPTYCRDAECQRVRVAERNRRSRARRAPRRARPRGENAFPEELDFIDRETWQADLAAERLEATGPGKRLGGENYFIGQELPECARCGKQLISYTSAVKILGTDRYHCQSCALAA